MANFIQWGSFSNGRPFYVIPQVHTNNRLTPRALNRPCFPPHTFYTASPYTRPIPTPYYYCGGAYPTYTPSQMNLSTRNRYVFAPTPTPTSTITFPVPLNGELPLTQQTTKQILKMQTC